MKDLQILSLMIASLPTMLTVLIGILINNARLSDLRAHMDARFADVDKRFADVDKRFADIDRRFNEVDRRFEQVDRRFDQVGRRFDQVGRRFDQVDRRFEETKELWRSELHRVEQVLDARLKHIEQD